MVKKRLDRIFKQEHLEAYWSAWARQKLQAKASLKNTFKPRVPELRKLEGVYDNPSHPDYPIHISCRYNDILRCSDTTHFTSCFRPAGSERLQPWLRCVYPDWAVIFVADKSGKFIGRTWIRYFSNLEWKTVYGHDDIPSYKSIRVETYQTYKIYGNKLWRSDVDKLLYNLVPSIELTKSMDLITDRQVRYFGGCSDDYLSFNV